MGDVCRSCRAEVIWRLTRVGRRQILDAAPNTHGNVLVLGPRRCITLNVAEVIDWVEGGGMHTLHLDHHVTCPQADEWGRG